MVEWARRSHLGEHRDDRLSRMLDAAPRVDAFWLGAAYQRALDAAAGGTAAQDTRRRRGIFYTPELLVEHLVSETLDAGFQRSCVGPPGVLDPACGCGGFLVAAARRLLADDFRLLPREVAEAMHGVDLDPLAVRLCRLALWLELGDKRDPSDTPDRFAGRVRVGDSLLDTKAPTGLDCVLTNPPFLSQLASGTARTRDATARLRERFGESVRPYTDPAALFLRLAADRVRPGGRVGIVLPVSTLASRDAAPVRRHIETHCSIRSLWLDQGDAFHAGVRAVALTLECPPGDARAVRRSLGMGFIPASPCAHPTGESGSWGPLASDLAGVPEVRLAGRRTLGGSCEITAGFRDEYYAITRGLVDAGPGETEIAGSRPVVTVGMIDLARLWFSEQPVRIAGRRWREPRVRPGPGDALLRALVARQARPKLLIATQSRLIEVAADPRGLFVALTPVITVIPHDPAELWRIGAFLASPQVSAYLGGLGFGTARAADAIKPTATMLRDLPFEGDADGWTRAGQSYREATEHHDNARRTAALLRCARSGLDLAGVSTAAAGTLFEWWRARLLARPGPREVSSATET